MIGGPLDKSFAEQLFDRTATAVQQAMDRERRSSGPDFVDDDAQRAAPVSSPRASSLSLLDFNVRDASRSDVIMRVSQLVATMGATLVLVGAPA